MKKLAWLCVPMLIATGSFFALAQDAEKPKEPKAEEVKEVKPAKEVEKEAAPAKAELDKAAPDFTLKDAAGKEHKLADYKGKIVVLEWINLDCPWCKAHYDGKDELVKLQKELAKEDVVWLVICSSAKGKQGNFEGETLKKRIEQAGLSEGQYLIDAEGAVAKLYEARTTPHNYVIDAEGVLKYRGALDNLRERRKDKNLEEINYVKLAVEALKAEKKVETAETTPYG